MHTVVGVELGWHYLLDLVWVLRATSDLPPSVIVDAGAGQGVLQFLLAERGHKVISVDFAARRFSPIARFAFDIKSTDGEESTHPYVDHLRARHHQSRLSVGWVANAARLTFRKLAAIARAALALPALLMQRYADGRRQPDIRIYQSPIENMDQLPDDSVSAVVSVSTLEHLDPKHILLAMSEMRRILKPGGRVAITTSAAEKHDWFHEPSRGWCFCEASLRELLGVDPACRSNWSAFAHIIGEIQESAELRRRLSPIYRMSGANGMPWGVWDPKYVPVGVAFD